MRFPLLLSVAFLTTLASTRTLAKGSGERMPTMMQASRARGFGLGSPSIHAMTYGSHPIEHLGNDAYGATNGNHTIDHLELASAFESASKSAPSQTAGARAGFIYFLRLQFSRVITIENQDTGSLTSRTQATPSAAKISPSKGPTGLGVVHPLPVN
jgi:hypothetical protein